MKLVRSIRLNIPCIFRSLFFSPSLYMWVCLVTIDTVEILLLSEQRFGVPVLVSFLCINARSNRELMLHLWTTWLHSFAQSVARSLVSYYIVLSNELQSLVFISNNTYTFTHTRTHTIILSIVERCANMMRHISPLTDKYDLLQDSK